ncbi:putative flagellar associated protein [Paratrimastix pyriformis]|uniref:Flagellar associated protein n=1 Tax=Paratrimastix pyriformis TaxID=342808 RepID=A0ABQ8U6K7_9EUKA|nr:putative flagellar associated protein [Paratrimastix pyriformis]
MNADEATLSEVGEWIYVGRNRCHRKAITDLQFSLSSSGQLVLFSIGADRRLVEFDLPNSGVLKGFKTKDVWVIEQTAIPTAALYCPAAHPPPQPRQAGRANARPTLLRLAGSQATSASAALAAAGGRLAASPQQPDEEEDAAAYKVSGAVERIGGVGPGDVIVVCNSEYKFRFLDAITKKTRRLTLAPTFGMPINRPAPPPPSFRCSAAPLHSCDGFGICMKGLLPIPGEKGAQFLGYLTPQKYDNNLLREFLSSPNFGRTGPGLKDIVVGLMKVPLDGNLNNTMGLIAHPGQVADAAFTADARYLITLGGADFTANVWRVNFRAMEETCLLQNQGITDIHTSMLEGGATGPFFDEMTDFFHYAQLRSQGEDATQARRITGRVPLEQVPNIMRAIGFYPTEQEIADLIADLEWVGREQTGITPTTVDLKEFLRVYVNHRPVGGITSEDIGRAFRQVGAEPLTGIIQKDVLTSALRTGGEAMAAAVLEDSLHALTGATSAELPTQLTAAQFAREVLGFNGLGEADEETQSAAALGLSASPGPVPRATRGWPGTWPRQPRGPRGPRGAWGMQASPAEGAVRFAPIRTRSRCRLQVFSKNRFHPRPARPAGEWTQRVLAATARSLAPSSGRRVEGAT